MPYPVFPHSNHQKKNIPTPFLSPPTSMSLSLSLSLSHTSLSLDALDMAVVTGNLALVLDVTSSRASLLDGNKPRPLPADVLLSLFKKEPYHHISIATSASSFEFDKESRNQRVGARGKANSKGNALDLAGMSDDEGNGNGNGNGYDDEEEEDQMLFGWEKAMRKSVREYEERRELEREAEELQSQAEELQSRAEDRGETEEDKRMRVRKELEKVAKEQAERRKMAQLMYHLGQKAYGRGMYGRAIEFLEGALTIIPRPTLFGGEIQIWLAMAYEANKRHADCIALYKELEKNHPNVSVRRQAGELRYILQAPKLKISQEEMVTIPMIGSSYDNYAGTWSDKYKDRDEKRFRSTTNQLPSTRDYIGDFLVWRPPSGLEKNEAFWVALTLWVGLVGAALFLQR
ncbi:hypothetical protein RHGRI_034312 [Rhododendron griersonianum]|uniref:Uncharacterized protein n=1 Tax=Rhododendron griersonianum TaxID=479676 RepID=A0AAV6I0K1_9ERIC|nr:hypothetical protein RHGRI_034312 [Rhododendron griersonianum]